MPGNQRFSGVFRGYKMKKQPPEVFYKKYVLKIFAVFTEKHLCWSLFLIKLQLFCERLLPKIRTLARNRLEGDFVTGVLLRIIKLHENRDSNTGVFLREIIQYSFL